MKEKNFYSLPTLFSNDYDPSKGWIVHYSYRDPFNGNMRRFRIKRGLDKSIAAEERKKTANSIIKKLTRQLQNGFNPFDEYFQPIKGIASKMVNSEHTWKKYLADFIVIKKQRDWKKTAYPHTNRKSENFYHTSNQSGWRGITQACSQ